MYMVFFVSYLQSFIFILLAGYIKNDVFIFATNSLASRDSESIRSLVAKISTKFSLNVFHLIVLINSQHIIPVHFNLYNRQ